MNQDTLESRYNPNLPEQLIDAIRISENTSDIMDEAFADLLGINRTDCRCLDILQRRGRITAGELAVESGLTTGSVTIVLDRLESKGYTCRVRSSADRRKVFVEATQLTEELANTIYSQAGLIGRDILGKLKPEELDLIVRFLRAHAAINHELSSALRQFRETKRPSDDPAMVAQNFASELTAQIPEIRARIHQSWES